MRPGTHIQGTIEIRNGGDQRCGTRKRRQAIDRQGRHGGK
jgi:hypothetical protein